MKYVLLVHDIERKLTDFPEPERAALLGEYVALRRDLQEGGHLLESAALQPAATARSVRVRGGQMQATDGPFAETREQIGGLFVIEAASMDEATAIAARVPAARLGTIEVRPVVDFSPAEAALRAGAAPAAAAR